MVDPGAGRAQGSGREDAAERRCSQNVERMGAPRLVEYWEQDPCRPEPKYDRDARDGRQVGRAAADGEAEAGQPRRHRRGAVHRRRVPDRDPVGEGFDRPRHLAAPREVQHPQGRRAAAPALRRGRHEVLRREGRSEEGEVRATAARTLSPLRFHYDSERVRAADPARPRQQQRHAGSDRQHPRPGPALRGRELQERHDPDQPRRQGDGPHAVRRVLRGAVRSHAREEPRRGRHRVRVAGARPAIRAPARR